MAAVRGLFISGYYAGNSGDLLYAGGADEKAGTEAGRYETRGRREKKSGTLVSQMESKI